MFNNTANHCPCCSSQLLRHARHSGVYWFCPHCWQEMPDLLSASVQPRAYRQQLDRLVELPSAPMRDRAMPEREIA
ncbi:hypothetical protein [Phormidium sp. CCY1219]|uniref:hypothetical protein n=1 Tax=Phormidium sp. CCY1219 TaxID=2886104 RepID=UPI002D1F639C|nr:hypothetical protein [Phormidium sp. CCY1219]MEB3831345.1 hypothetical protein [Phormidium sp. CCY1219]